MVKLDIKKVKRLIIWDGLSTTVLLGSPLRAARLPGAWQPAPSCAPAWQQAAAGARLWPGARASQEALAQTAGSAASAAHMVSRDACQG